jgi:capsular exopolysaccharide synthesis family protein
MKEMSINERLETSNIRVIDQAIPPGSPINSGKKRIVGKWLVLGLILGIGLAFGFEYLDNSIKTPEDIKQFLGIQFLGFIPKMTAKARKSFQPEKVMIAAPQSVVSEAYRSVRTSVTFSALPNTSNPTPGGQILLITSAEPSEGKSCTVANLAIAMAQSGKKTLIIDCDFRRPQIHKVFDVDNEHGFADLLSSFKTYGKIRIKRTEVPNLDVFPCGHIPPNPSELLESPAAPKIIRALATRYDAILIDSPPINSVTDPVILSRLTQGVVMVIRAGETKRDMVQRATDQLADAGANILGGVINNVDIQKNKYYYYYAYHYSYYYKKDDVAIAIK